MSLNQPGAATATLEDLLSCHDERFIHNAYHVLLDRAPDPAGMRYYLGRIRIGISKVEILAQLLLSKEGKSRLVRIAGLNEAISRHQLLRTPLLGALLQLLGIDQTERGLLQNSSPFVNFSLEKIQDNYQAFLRGETHYSKKLAQSYLRFHLDTPQIELVNIVKDSCTVSGWAVDLVDKLAVKVRIVVGHEVHASIPRQREDVQKEFSHICELPLATGFSCVLKLPLGVHRMRIEVEGVDGSWIPVRSTVLIRIPGKTRLQSRKPRLSYRDWVHLDQQELNTEIPNTYRTIAKMVLKPTFTVVVDTRQGRTGLQDTIQSVRSQLYPCWELRVISSTSTVQLPDDVKILKDLSLSDIRGNFIILMQSGGGLTRAYEPSCN